MEQSKNGFLTSITQDTDQWHQITINNHSLQQEGSRVHAKLNGRFVSVVKGRSQLYCIDAVCYHMGGPLTVGDIEEVNGEICIKCPWHHYNVTLDTGAKLYQAMDFDPTTKKLVPTGWKASEHRQRVHEVEERGHQRAVWVRLSSNDKGASRYQEADTLDYVSDKWAYNAGAAGNCTRPGMNKGGDGRTAEKMRMSGDGRHPNRRGVGGGGKSGGSGGRGGHGGYRPSGSVLADARANAAKTGTSGTGTGTGRRAGRYPGTGTLGGMGGKHMQRSGRPGVGSARIPVNASLKEEDEEEGEDEDEDQDQDQVMSLSSAMAPDQWNTYRLTNKKQLSHDTWVYRFALPSSTSSLGWSAIERHVRVRATSLSTGQSIVREYTPISNPLDTNGRFDLAIKLYAQGEMSQIFARLNIGEGLEMCGPFGELTIQENPQNQQVEICSTVGTFRAATRITMIAAGSGITPMIQILNVMSSSFSSTAQPVIDVLAANQTYKDILFRAHLANIQKTWRNDFNVFHALSRVSGEGGQKYGDDVVMGRIDVARLTSLCGNGGGEDGGHFWLLCGSRDFEMEMKVTLVQGLNVLEQNVLTF